MVDKKVQGKKNRASGQRFELKVRKDLESKEWIVSKWMNNVEGRDEMTGHPINNPPHGEEGHTCCDYKFKGKLIPAKHKFRGLGIPMAIGTGFPDFIAFKHPDYPDYVNNLQEIIGVEVKSNGYLTKEEKEKYKWYLENNIFSKILIASKGEKRGKIVYKEFKC